MICWLFNCLQMLVLIIILEIVELLANVVVVAAVVFEVNFVVVAAELEVIMLSCPSTPPLHNRLAFYPRCSLRDLQYLNFLRNEQTSSSWDPVFRGKLSTSSTA